MDMDDFVKSVLFVALILFLPLMCGAVQYSNFVSAEAKIEQLRADLQEVSVQESEDVIGQVTAWNQTIAEKKAWNDKLFFCMFIPNGWDRIEPLEIPNR